MDSHATWEEGACPRAPVSAQGEDPTTLATGVWPLGEGISYPPEPTGSPTVPINPRREWRPNPTGEGAQSHVRSQSNSSRAEDICRY